MPTYEYECRKCGDFEQEQRMIDPALTACPSCGEPVKRKISGGAGFIVRRAGCSSAEGKAGCTWNSRGRTCCGRDRPCEGH